MQISNMLDWPLAVIILGGLAIIFLLGITLGWSLWQTWRLTRRG